MNVLDALWHPEENEAFELHPYTSTPGMEYLVFKTAANLYVMFHWLNFWYTNQWGFFHLINLENHLTY